MGHRTPDLTSDYVVEEASTNRSLAAFSSLGADALAPSQLDVESCLPRTEISWTAHLLAGLQFPESRLQNLQ